MIVCNQIQNFQKHFELWIYNFLYLQLFVFASRWMIIFAPVTCTTNLENKYNIKQCMIINRKHLFYLFLYIGNKGRQFIICLLQNGLISAEYSIIPVNTSSLVKCFYSLLACYFGITIFVVCMFYSMANMSTILNI